MSISLLMLSFADALRFVRALSECSLISSGSVLR